MVAEKWHAAISNPQFEIEAEVKPSFPLHDPAQGWITAEYLDGRIEIIDLTTVLKDAHLISGVALENSVSTVSLYRILLSLVYPVLDATLSQRDWENARLSLMQENAGIDPTWVDEYFEKYQDRFYVIHPSLPFLQDPSLAQTFQSTPLAFNDDEEGRKAYRAAWSGSMNGISQVHPLAPSIAKENGQKAIWGLPKEEIFDIDAPLSTRTSSLMTSLLHQRYSHSATNRGQRTFFDKTTENDTHHAAHSLRCAVSFMVEVGSLYQNLLLAMNYVPSEELANDIPEWERAVNPDTGYLELFGRSIDYHEVYAGPKAPRSSVNLTHMSMLFVPQFDPVTGSMSVEGGQVRQLRRLLFNFKHLNDVDGNKLPFPLSWNPYIAVKPDGKALKQVMAVSSKTVFGNPSVAKIPLLPEQETKKPQSLTNAEGSNPYLRNVFDPQQMVTRIFVFAGDASQDKTYSDFSLITKEYAASLQDDESVYQLERWINAGVAFKAALTSTIKYSVSSDSNAKISLDAPAYAFWNDYYALFLNSLNGGIVEPLETYKQQITSTVMSIFDEYTATYIKTIPMDVAKNRRTLLFKVYKEFTEEGR